MKKISFFHIIMLLALLSAFANANGTPGIVPTCYCGTPPTPCICDGATISVAPHVVDSLEHKYFYIWEIDNLVVPAGEEISAAGLYFVGINDWKVEDGDNMYIHLLSDGQISDAVSDLGLATIVSTSNTKVYRGDDGTGTWVKDGDLDDDLTGYGELIDTYTDDNEYKSGWCWINPPENYCYEFDEQELALLNSYLASGIVGIGLDPDCWYTPNTDADWIKLWYCTTPTIPAPGAIVLGGIGVGLVGWLRKRKTL